MSRKNKIIVSVVGIFIILLALVGITYGYFLTQIQGNTNDNSIYVTTANLQLIYDDKESIIRAENISPGETKYTKTFSVTNNGNKAVEYDVYIESVINNLVHEEDLILKITCKIGAEVCNGYGVDNDAIYPTENSRVITNSINPEEVHEYTLTLQFKDDGTDQSVDMGKTIQGKVQIYDHNDVFTLIGKVENAESNYYVELHSEEKMSEIDSEGNYILTGVTPGEHTLYIKELNSDGSSTVISSKEITVGKSESTNLLTDNANLIVTENTTKAEVNIILNEDEITFDGVEITENPYSKETLANRIIDNAMHGFGDKTIYRETPLTEPGTATTNGQYIKNEEKEEIKLITNLSDNGIILYSDNYSYNDTGWFSFDEYKEVTFENLNASFIGKYITKSTYINGDIFNIQYLYKILDIIVDSDGTKTIKTKRIFRHGINLENTLSIAEDEYTETTGNNSYYFRGGVTDNYLEFNNMCFRIVRIEGDGSIKVTLTAEKKCNEISDSDIENSFINSAQKVSYGTDEDGYFDYQNGELKTTLETWYIDNGFNNLESKLKNETWCLGASKNYRYDTNGLLIDSTSTLTSWFYSSNLAYHSNEISYICGYDEDNFNSYVGLLTLDDVIYAGAKLGTFNPSYYLNDNGFGFYKLLTVDARYINYDTDSNFSLYAGGGLFSNVITTPAKIRPVITLKANVLYSSGEGTKTNPYIVE